MTYLFTVHLNVSNIVLKDSGNIDLWELVLAEHNEQARLATGSISHYHQLFSNRCHN